MPVEPTSCKRRTHPSGDDRDVEPDLGQAVEDEVAALPGTPCDAPRATASDSGRNTSAPQL